VGLAILAMFQRQTGEAGAMPALSRNCIVVERSGICRLLMTEPEYPSNVASNALREKGEDT
jgi:hypothetical protein